MELNDAVYQAGVNEGRNEMRKVALDFLQAKYLDPATRPDRNSEEAQYLLGMASDLAEHLRNA